MLNISNVGQYWNCIAYHSILNVIICNHISWYVMYTIHVHSILYTGGQIQYDSSDELQTKKGQCCLRASHFCFTFLVLLIISAGLLIASFHNDNFIKFRTPAGAILSLSVLLAAVSGCVALFVELHVQDSNNCCRRLHRTVCCLALGTDDFPTELRLEQRGKYQHDVTCQQDVMTCKVLVTTDTCDACSV